VGRLFTSSYRAWCPELGVPVRTSLGVPRWMTAPLVDWPAVYPYGLFGKDLDEATFTTKYRARLHRQGRHILAELQDLREAYGDLVLLCFEPADRFCHRRVLSTWLEEKLGEPVEEVMPTVP
jgi:uncharacterized protein (DUF488 family)